MNETVESAVDGEDPVVGEFLRFLARDMQSHPEHIRAVGLALAERLRALTCDVSVDLDGPLSPEDD